VLLHGYTNSPAQMDSLANLLYREGDNVYVPRLPHHAERAGRAANLALINAEELRDASDSAVDIAAGLGDSVVVLGLSLGGTMAAWIAQQRADVRRVVIAAPIMALARVPHILEMAALNLALRLPNFTHADRPDPRQPDRELGWSTHGVAEILRLGLAARRAARDASPPAKTLDIRILLNAHDHTIARQPVLELAEHWADRGTSVLAYELPDSLQLPHDVIDPRQHVKRPDVVYPILVALVGGETPSSALLARVAIRR
jgi:esterase/lipase